MERIAIIISLAFAVPAMAHDHTRTIDLAADLVHWCKSEAESRYVAKNITPSNWTASYYDRDGIFYVNGSLRAHDSNINVKCRIAQGAREEYAVIEIADPTL
jgi:hypothetical protein